MHGVHVLCARAFYRMPFVVLPVTVDSESDLKITQRDAIAASLISVTVHKRHKTTDEKCQRENISNKNTKTKKTKKEIKDKDINI